MIKKQSINLDFEIAVQYEMELHNRDEFSGLRSSTYSVLPHSDQDFWSVIFGQDMNDFVAVLHAGEDVEFALSVLSLRLHDYATGKSFAHGQNTQVPSTARFIMPSGEVKHVNVPKMQNL